MNQTRSFLLIAWLVVATLLWMEWSKGPQPTTAAAPDGMSAPAEVSGAAAAAPAAEIGRAHV